MYVTKKQNEKPFQKEGRRYKNGLPAAFVHMLQSTVYGNPHQT